MQPKDGLGRKFLFDSMGFLTNINNDMAKTKSDKLMVKTGVSIAVLLLKLKKLEPNDSVLRNFVKSK